MCIAIYVALLALLFFYADYNLEQYALSVSSSDEQWTVVALGWEILPHIWPAMLLMMVAASALTLLISRRFRRKDIAA